jgi:2-polyprenyl-6-methoxyphenol hydroxylase-like FAD-dependent oxidoreductase
MPAWSKGRVVFVGDAGYCASPAAGMGGSLAIDGAAALADAMRAHPSDYARAFREYDVKLRPFIDEVQAEAVRVGLESLVPRTEEAMRARNAKRGMISRLLAAKRQLRTAGSTARDTGGLRNDLLAELLRLGRSQNANDMSSE